MRLRYPLPVLAFTLLAEVGCAQPPVETAQPPTAAVIEPAAVETARNDPAGLLPNGKLLADGVLVGGQPTADQFQQLAALGYGTVVNLRTTGEQGDTDPALIESLGMEYVSLPISGADTLTEDNARKLAAVLADAGAPVVVHCASGNRVGALFALKALYVDGSSPQEALAIGKQAGVTRLEPVVRQKLGLE